MKKGGIGGGKTTTGLRFEDIVSLEQALGKIEGYKVEDNTYVFFSNEKVAEIYKKHSLYKNFLVPHGIDYTQYISKKLLPDNAIYVIAKGTLYIIEVKYQEVAGSVDEKLQTCDFKKKQYQRLLQPLDLNVEYCYVLSEWFLQKEYRDVLNYIQAVGCKYFFGEIPLDYLGLPTPISHDG